MYHVMLPVGDRFMCSGSYPTVQEAIEKADSPSAIVDDNWYELLVKCPIGTPFVAYCEEGPYWMFYDEDALLPALISAATLMGVKVKIEASANKVYLSDERLAAFLPGDTSKFLNAGVKRPAKKAQSG